MIAAGERREGAMSAFEKIMAEHGAVDRPPALRRGVAEDDAPSSSGAGDVSRAHPGSPRGAAREASRAGPRDDDGDANDPPEDKPPRPSREETIASARRELEVSLRTVRHFMEASDAQKEERIRHERRHWSKERHAEAAREEAAKREEYESALFGRDPVLGDPDGMGRYEEAIRSERVPHPFRVPRHW